MHKYTAVFLPLCLNIGSVVKIFTLFIPRKFLLLVVKRKTLLRDITFCTAVVSSHHNCLIWLTSRPGPDLRNKCDAWTEYVNPIIQFIGKLHC